MASALLVGACLRTVGPLDGDGSDPADDAGSDGPVAGKDSAHEGLVHVDGSSISTSCSDRYGSIEGFVLCPADVGSCTFFFDLPDYARTSCVELCAVGGGSCVDAHNGDDDHPCIPKPPCEVVHLNGLCTCSLTDPNGCESQYGELPNYFFCDEANGACEFFYESAVAGVYYSCDELCAQHGGACLAAEDTSELGCTPRDPCGNSDFRGICTCTLD